MKNQSYSSESTQQFLRYSVWIAAVVVAMISLLDITGWLFNVEIFRSFGIGLHPMKPIVAVCFLLGALTLPFLYNNELRGKFKIIPVGLGAVIGLIVIIILSYYINLSVSGNEMKDTDRNLIQSLVRDKMRMSLFTALNFLFISISIILQTINSRQAINIAHTGLIFPVILSYLVPVSYVLGVQKIHQFLTDPISLNSGIAFCVLIFGLLCSRPESWVMVIFTNKQVGGLMVRRVLPALLLLPIIIGLIWLYSENLKVFNSEIGITLVTMVYTVTILVIIWLNARVVNKRDEKLTLTSSILSEAQRIAKIGNWEWNMTTGEIFWSDQIFEIFEEEKGKFIPISLELMPGIHPDDRTKMEQTYREAASGKGPCYLDYRLIRKDGSIRNIGLRCNLNTDSSEDKILNGTIQDITEMKLTEELMRKTRDYLEKIFNYSNTPFICWNPDNKITRFNRAFESMTGYSQEEVLDKDLTLLFPDDSKQGSVSKIRRTLSGEFWADVEIPILTKSGNVRIALWNSANIYAEDGKTLLTTIAQGQDITERKRTEKLLHEKNAQLQSIMDNTQDLIYRFDLRSGNYPFFSSSTTEVLGFSPEELRSMSPEETLSRVHKDDRDKVSLAITRLLTTGREHPEYRWQIKNGDYRWLSEKMTLIRNMHGEPQYRDGVIRDITESRLLKEETEKILDLVQEEKDRISSLINSMVDEVWFTDTKKRFSLANSSGWSMSSLKTDDTLDVEEFASSIEFIRSDGSPRPIEETPSLLALKGEVIKNQEEIIRIPDSGQFHYREISANPVKNSKGVIIGSVAVVRDITDRKIAQEKLTESQATLIGILNATTESIWLLNDEGKILLGNKTALERIGRTPEMTYGKFIYELGPEKITQSRMEYLREVVHTGHMVTFEDERANIKFEHNFFPITDTEGKVKRVAVFSRDITQQKKAEETLNRSHQELEELVKNRTSELEKINELLKREIFDREKAEKVLLHSQQQLRALTKRIDEIADKERTDIAHEIHDEIGHLLTALKFEIENMASSTNLSVKSMKCDLESLINIVNSLLDSVRRISTQLHPGILDHLGLIPAIEWRLNQFKKNTKIFCNFDNNLGELEFNKEETRIIFQIFQEILTNVARHSKAKKVNVSLNKKDNHFVLKVADNGKGFIMKDNIHKGSFGLMGMHERALSIGADLQIDSILQKGTMITFSLAK